MKVKSKIKGKPSLTAATIAKVICGLKKSKKYNHIATDDMVLWSRILLAESVKYDGFLRFIDLTISDKEAVWLVDNVFIAGVAVHYIMRKNYIRKKIDEAIAADPEMRQVIVIGSGLDSLSLEYSTKYPHVNFYEIDREGTLQIKRNAMVGRNYNMPPNVHLLHCDLSCNSLANRLLEFQSFDAAKKSIFIIEGVLMYLRDMEADFMFKEIGRIAPSGSKLIFGCIDSKNAGMGKFGRFITKTMLFFRKEVMRFKRRPEEIAEYLSKFDFKLEDTITYDELQKDVEPPAKIERLKQLGGEHYYTAVKK